MAEEWRVSKTDPPPPPAEGDKPASSADRDELSPWRLVHVFQAPGPSASLLPQQQHYPLRWGAQFLGRCTSTDIVSVFDMKISRRHARIVCESDHVIVSDAGSTNRLFLNGHLVSTDFAALSGDVLRAGSSLFVLARGPLPPSDDERATRFGAIDVPGIMYGDTGTGKEHFARLIHDKSGRPGGFRVIDCPNLNVNTAQAELFGCVRGAFTGAEARHGLFRAAHRGTAFIDEIPNLSLEVQAALLGALDRKRIKPLGTTTEIDIDVRVIVASPIDLSLLVREGSFRPDLFARFKGWNLKLPLLRERRSDFFRLFWEFASRHAVRFTLPVDVAELLLLHSWPYNIRELKMFVEMASQLVPPSPNGTRVLTREYLRSVDIFELPPAPQLVSSVPASSACSAPSAGASSSADATLFAAEPAGASDANSKHPKKPRKAPTPYPGVDVVLAVWQEANWNISQAARSLGVYRQQVQRWIRQHDLRRRGLELGLPVPDSGSSRS